MRVDLLWWVLRGAGRAVAVVFMVVTISTPASQQSQYPPVCGCVVVQGCSRNVADDGVHATTLLNGSLIISYANIILSEGRCRVGGTET